MTSLDTPLVDVVGARSAKKLADELSLHTVADLLAHYPRKYYERGDASSESGLVNDDHLSFHAKVLSSEWIPNRNTYDRRKGRCVLTLELKEGSIDAIFWNQPWIASRMQRGDEGFFTGVVGTFRGKWQLNSPSVVKISDEAEEEPQKGLTLTNPATWTSRLIPIYPATSKLDSFAIQRSVHTVLEALPPLDDPLTAQQLAERKLIDLDTAIRAKHQPETGRDWREADKRLKLHEAMAMQLVLSLERHRVRSLDAVPRPLTGEGAHSDLVGEFERALPFTLTDGQREIIDTISADLSVDRPMHRLLQGEVGSGKTVVALRAMLQVAASGGQSVLLAPTEVLAFQHARSIRALLGSLGIAGELGSHPDAIKVVTITGSLSAADRRAALLDVASGAASIVIGTHALLEPTVSFADLGLVVIDEQHRFGVEQRDVLRRKSADGSVPHTLVMTATPIPRTIAITAFGDLEISTLREIPAGRQPVATTVISASDKPAWLLRAWERVQEEVAAGHQAYVVAPRIGLDDSEADSDAAAVLTDDAGSDTPKMTSVLELHEYLYTGPLAGLRTEVLHGRMPAEQKDRIMRRFTDGETDVLVSTTVIEVGVDVPNATVMVVVDAERFGLATLHQLRGRIGRGLEPGLCLLVTTLTEHSGGFARLRELEHLTDGFALAEMDLRIRREGDVLGVAQSGTRSRLRLLSILDDEEIIEEARKITDAIVEADPQLSEHPLLRANLAALERSAAADFLGKG